MTANITDIEVDCAHNDWTWIDGTKKLVLPCPLHLSTDIPGNGPNHHSQSVYQHPWRAIFGCRVDRQVRESFLFGGDGWELSGNSAPDTLNAPMDDLWVCVRLATTANGSWWAAMTRR